MRADVVARVRKLAGTRKVGHAGTLDVLMTPVGGGASDSSMRRQSACIAGARGGSSRPASWACSA
mgnify:CR=1 FL=1